jgi:hypothetical protein
MKKQHSDYTRMSRRYYDLPAICPQKARFFGCTTVQQNLNHS